MIQRDEIVDRSRPGLANTRHKLRQFRAHRLGMKIGGKFANQSGVIGERKLLGFLFQEEIEWIDDRHLGDEIDFNRKLFRLFRKDQPGKAIAIRILLPVDEVILRLDGQ